MRYNRLGTTGLFVSELSLGSMTFGIPEAKYAAAGGLNQDQVDALVRRAFDAGINLIDTANVYSNGQSEQMIGHALQRHGIARHEVVLATKAAHATGAGPNDAGTSRHHLMHQVKQSLRRLGTDHIDLYQLHGWDPATPIEESLRALDDLVRQGHVRYVGVSNWAAWQTARAVGVSERLNLTRPHAYQGYYSLPGRDAERELLPMLAAEQMALLVFSPLAGGYLTGKYRQDRQEGRRATVPFPPVDEPRSEGLLTVMDDVAKTHGTTLEAVALAWLRQQPAVTSIVLGVTSVQQLDANLLASDVVLSADALTALDHASALAPEYPGWMIANGNVAREALMTNGTLTI
ncbi:aldo/keto reductase [Xanthomonas arboricola]|uniref:Aldo/keto reductase n=1 Tax=Xanthomonas arboricola TaxID=56448 RepID=A0A2S7AB35_9XANT|nr:aldo/keto reductase [Xanthomonas arboricola]PPU06358.1 aldo/keto reductase [Xanthomonas arboricola]